jgi:hypothetical protein
LLFPETLFSFSFLMSTFDFSCFYRTSEDVFGLCDFFFIIFFLVYIMALCLVLCNFLIPYFHFPFFMSTFDYLRTSDVRRRVRTVRLFSFRFSFSSCSAIKFFLSFTFRGNIAILIFKLKFRHLTWLLRTFEVVFGTSDFQLRL